MLSWCLFFADKAIRAMQWATKAEVVSAYCLPGGVACLRVRCPSTVQALQVIQHYSCYLILQSRNQLVIYIFRSISWLYIFRSISWCFNIVMLIFRIPVYYLVDHSCVCLLIQSTFLSGAGHRGHWSLCNGTFFQCRTCSGHSASFYNIWIGWLVSFILQFFLLELLDLVCVAFVWNFFPFLIGNDCILLHIKRLGQGSWTDKLFTDVQSVTNPTFIILNHDRER
jgi:hypothetical protein